MLKPYHRFTSAVLDLVQPYSSTEIAPAATVWGYVKSHIPPLKGVLLLSLFITVLAASIEVWLISYAGTLIDTLAETPREDMLQTHGAKLSFAAVVLLLFRPLLQMLRHALNDIGLNCNIATLVRWRAHDHLANQSVGWFQEDLTGRTAVRLVDIGNHVADIIYQWLNAMAFGLVYMIGIVALMSETDPRLALPLFIWFLLYVGVMTLFIPPMVNAQQTFQSAKSALTGVVVDGFSNIDTLKLFSDRDLMVNDHKLALEHTRQTLFVTRQISVSLRTILTALEGIMMVGFVGYGIWLWTQELATIGLIGAAIALSLRITTMAEWVFESLRWIFLRVGSLREGLKTIAQPLAIPITKDAPDLSIKGGEITINNVRHQYGTYQGGLDGVSLTVKSGEKVGLVGRSGAGKSTLVNLILRFHEAEEGSICIDSQNICHVDQDSLRSAIGMVSQQAALLNRSVRENIALGRTGVTQQQIETAAKEARAHDFILQLKDAKGRTGYDAHVGERGIKLSGGQRQRIALSRVILKSAPILILDEATSALDSEVEAEIQMALDAVMQNKTVIAIAHRLSTIASMDRIIVFDAGKIVEEGSHEQLLATGGLYANFWHRQSGGFISTEPNSDNATE